MRTQNDIDFRYRLKSIEEITAEIYDPKQNPRTRIPSGINRYHLAPVKVNLVNENSDIPTKAKRGDEKSDVCWAGIGWFLVIVSSIIMFCMGLAQG